MVADGRVFASFFPSIGSGLGPLLSFEGVIEVLFVDGAAGAAAGNVYDRVFDCPVSTCN